MKLLLVLVAVIVIPMAAISLFIAIDQLISAAFKHCKK